MEDCIFCKIGRGETKSWKVYEDEHTYAFLDIRPANRYHALVIPKNHYQDIFDTPAEELGRIMATIKKVTSLYKEKLGIENVQIMNSSGREAQQDVFHVHFHIIPRNITDGQDIKRETHPEWVEEYDSLLERLN